LTRKEFAHPFAAAAAGNVFATKEFAQFARCRPVVFFAIAREFHHFFRIDGKEFASARGFRLNAVGLRVRAWEELCNDGLHDFFICFYFKAAIDTTATTTMISINKKLSNNYFIKNLHKSFQRKSVW